MKAMIKFFGTAFIFLLVNSVQAQFALGLKSGWTFQNITTPSGITNILPKFKTNRSLTVGAVAEYGFTDNFALQGELNFVRKGFVIKEGTDLQLMGIPIPLGVKATTNLKYVEVPLLAKFRFGTQGAIGGYLVAGPTVGYARSGNFKTSANVFIDINLIDTPIDFDAINVSRWDVGGAIGAGATANLVGGSKLFLDARFTQGFTKLDDLGIVDVDFTNRGVALTGGFLIPLGKKNTRVYAMN